MEREFRYFKFSTRLKILLVTVVSVLVLLFAFNLWINIDVAQTTYLSKAGIDWWNNVVLLKGDFLLLCLVLPLLAIDPRVTHCKVLGILRHVSWALTWLRLREPKDTLGPVFDDKFSIKTGLAYQGVTYGFFFLLSAVTGAFGLALPFHMAKNGVGAFDLQTMLRILQFPISPPTSTELIALTPTIETWYLIAVTCLTILLFVWILRLVLGGVGEILVGGVGRALRNFAASFSLGSAWLLLRTPYSEFDITSPNIWGILVALELISIVATVILHVHRENLKFERRRVWAYTATFGIILIILVANLGLILIYRLQWDRSWLQYEWLPQTSKEIDYTRWATGISGWQYLPISDLGSTNTTEILPKIRQWDSEASITKMKSQIGVNWLTLADSDILYLSKNEYGVCPTSINYEIAGDWISRHFIYTNTPRVIVINSHTGDFVQPEGIFNLTKMPRIYYGEGFDTAYVQVPGFTEIGNVTYQDSPDYILKGIVRAWWFLLEGQIGFALNPPKDEVAMLWNRDVKSRVQTMLLDHLTIDNDVFLVTDGQRLYYCVQVFVDYPLSSGFAQGRYIRFMGVVTVDVANGDLKGYSVSESDGFLLDFYKRFYDWPNIPPWLKSQIRVPETYYGTQLDVDYRYHVSDPTIWRSHSDDFEKPADTSVNYILVTRGGSTIFVAVQVAEYASAPGLNLAGLYMAPSGTEYGKEVSFYRVSSDHRLIGPSAARQAFETNTAVRTQLSLLSTYRFGNVLLYNIGGGLYYFIPVYAEVTTGEAVIVKLAFVGCIEASTGESVSMGADALSAYNTLVHALPVGEEERLAKIDSSFVAEGITVDDKATDVHGNVELLEGATTYINENQWGDTQTAIKAFVENYCKPNNVAKIYRWITSQGTVKYANYGFLVNDQGLITLYYIQIQYAT